MGWCKKLLKISFTPICLLTSHFDPWLMLLLNVKCNCTEMHLFSCLICWWFCFVFCCSHFPVVCKDFLVAVGTEIDAYHTWTCINLSHLLNWHCKSPRFDSSFNLLCLSLESEQICNGNNERVLTWTCGRMTFLEKALLGSPCPPLVISCWCKCCLCQTDEISREAGCDLL